MITDDDVMSATHFQTGEDMITDDDVMSETTSRPAKT